MVGELKSFWVSAWVAVLVSSCDRPPPGTTDPVISETLDGVAEILTGDASEQLPPVEPVPEKTDEKPAIPTAEPVPDKPGFVISPFNGKWIDVSGIPVGETVADPDFPPEEKKYFRVPEPLAVPEPVPPPAGEVDDVTAVSEPSAL